MTKNLLRPFLWGILTFSLLSSCRTEDNISKQNQEDKRFATFTSQSGKTINYANGFASLMIKYDELNKSNLSGIANKPLLSASSDKNGSTATGSYIEFNVRSQVIKNSDGNIWVVFPKVENGTVISLIVSLLSEKETYLSYYSVDKSDEFYKTNTPLFQEAYNRYKKRNMRLALSASTSIQFMANNDCENRPNERCSDIEEVIITNPRPIHTPDPGLYIPPEDPGNGDGPTIPTQGGCGSFGDCSRGSSNNGSGNQQKDMCSQMKAQNESTDYQNTIKDLRGKTNLKHESGYSENKSGKFTELKVGTSTENSDSMSITFDSNTKGYAHTHLNDFETGKENEDGLEVKKPIRMFSPADVNTLMEIVKFNKDSGDFSQYYGTMVSSSGTYTIKFTGTAADIKTGFDTEEWRKDYVKFRTDNPTWSNEQLFLKFLKDKMNVNGISLYKVDKKGNSTKKELGLKSNGKLTVNSIDCPK
ncbi:hypothetical protein M2T82_09170 [Elizabethkingia ursingii]|uniref:hypothetical protein n=1 Tax=Elizabethkingia ursingii TaxID=1756150 RepID=UPI0020127FC5|nr:hypothetical protein [Elizabethkingia ursingii]MCL1668228.1 hypothetical protein [Elizabethkingia ursingii]